MSPDELECLFGREGLASAFGESLDPKRVHALSDLLETRETRLLFWVSHGVSV
jgi:hypothetical protein